MLLVLLIALPNLRYLYPAMPLLSIGIGNILVEWPALGTCAMVGITALNLYFLPASGWYHRDFALFKHSDARDYVRRAAPIRTLIAYLNHYQSGKPVALFTGDAVAGLNGPAYTNTWHSEQYWKRVRGAALPRDIATILRGLRIETIVAPVSLESQFSAVQSFLHLWAEPTGIRAEDLAIYHLLSEEERHGEVAPLPAGSWDDLDDRIEYRGHWLHDRQFPKSSGQSLTYSADVGDSFGLKFLGTGITYVYTRAENRGEALVSIDGNEAARIDMYSPDIQWQSKSVFGKLAPGLHTFEVKILPEKRSKATAVDVDRVDVIE